MGESNADLATQPSNGEQRKAPAQRRPAYLEEEGVFPRLQERTQTQLGFINSLLITLAVGLLAFAANASGSTTELSRLGWRKWLVFAGLVALALSVLSGLRLAHNRLASHRVTTRVARLRQLRDRYRYEQRDFELRRLGRQAAFFKTWAKWSWSKRPEKRQIHDAALALAASIPAEFKNREQQKPTGAESGPRSQTETEGGPATPYIAVVPSAVTGLVEALRTWYERADNWTWWWLRAQTWSFMIGALLLLVVPVSYY